jgi:hypothetical protein
LSTFSPKDHVAIDIHCFSTSSAVRGRESDQISLLVLLLSDEPDSDRETEIKTDLSRSWVGGAMVVGDGLRRNRNGKKRKEEKK